MYSSPRWIRVPAVPGPSMFFTRFFFRFGFRIDALDAVWLIDFATSIEPPGRSRADERISPPAVGRTAS